MPLFQRFRRAAVRLLPAVTLVQVLACHAGPSEPPPVDTTGTRPPVDTTKPPADTGTASPTPDTLFTIEGVPTAGGTLVLRGGVAGSGATVLMDGAMVEIVSASDSSLTVRVPSLAACETDGRALSITVSRAGKTVKAVTPLSVPGLTLALGESRVVSDPSCLQFPRGDARYAFSVSGMVLGAGDASGRLLVGNGGTSGAAAAPVSGLHSIPSGAVSPLYRSTRAGLGTWNQQPSHAISPTRDAALATATVGDAVALPHPSGATCAPSDTNNLRPFRVVAVAGQSVVAIATDIPEAANVVGREEWAAVYSGAAGVIDQWLDPAITAVLGQAPQWYPTADGRRFILLDTLPQGIAGYPVRSHSESTAKCPSSWQMNAIVLNARVWAAGETTPDQRSRLQKEMAGFALHEFTHVADVHLSGLRAGSVGGWFTEAVAQSVVETAVRLASGHQPATVRTSHDAAGIHPPVQLDWIASGDNRGFQQHSGPVYGRGALIWLMARELDGTAAAVGGNDKPALYRRLLAVTGGQEPTLEQLATVVNLTSAALFDRTTIATVLGQTVLESGHPGPQFSTWRANDFLATQPSYRIAPGATVDQAYTVGGGGLWARFIETNPSIGAAVRATPPAEQAQLRVTRVR